jgi:hypothetical protein
LIAKGPGRKFRRHVAQHLGRAIRERGRKLADNGARGGI